MYDRVYSGKYPLIEYTNPNSVRRMIREVDNKWYIALDGENNVVGSMVAILQPWNLSYELGRVVVISDLWGMGITTRLYESMREELNHYPIEWVTMRSNPTCHIARKFGLIPVGILPGKHLVQNREIHILFMILKEGGGNRIQPPNNRITSSLYVRRLIEGMKIPFTDGNYPEDIVVGPPDSQFKIKDCEIEYDYISGDNAITINRISPSSLETMYSLLSVPPLLEADYIEMMILADKKWEISKLMKNGFHPCGYFPSWYSFENQRYDGILVARSKILNEIFSNQSLGNLDESVEKEVRRFREDFSI